MDFLIFSFSALLTGFLAAAPVGLIGVGCAMAALRHDLRTVLRLIGGVLCADAVVVGAVNVALAAFPRLDWPALRAWDGLWWTMVGLLATYGVLLLAWPRTLGAKALNPALPFGWAMVWTLLANPKNWLGTFALFAGWKVAGFLPTPWVQAEVAALALLGGALAWALWATVWWHARRWHAPAEVLAQRLVGGLCLLAAALAAAILLST